jgi:hypothetical protein
MDMMINEILMKLNDEEQKYIFNLKNKNDTENANKEDSGRISERRYYL